MKIVGVCLVVLCQPLLTACVSLDYVFPQTSVLSISAKSMSSSDKDAKRDPDSDRDGVPDWTDLCAESVSEKRVDANGCEISTGVVEGLIFAPDDVQLSRDAQLALDRTMNAFLRYPDIILSVTSHTDNRGSAADNLALSKQRLNTVVSYMVMTGIEARRIQPFAYGESRPRAPNATLEGRERNRRIEIHVIERLP